MARTKKDKDKDVPNAAEKSEDVKINIPRLARSIEYTLSSPDELSSHSSHSSPSSPKNMYPVISFGHGVDHKYLNGYRSEESTVTWGELEFQEAGHRQSLFMVSNKAQISLIYDLVKEYWCLPAPNLLVSVVSEEGQDEVKSWVRKALRQGLVRAVQSTGAWIITSGLRKGVSRCVGEAVRDHTAAASMPTESKVIALGVSPLSLVTGRQHPSSTQESCRLDCNYQGFLLLDDQSEVCKGIETDFITELEHYIACKAARYIGCNKKHKIPVLCLLIYGGASVLKRMGKSLKKATPWLVLSGTGPAADMVSELLNGLSPFPVDTGGCDDTKLKDSVRQIVRKHFPDEITLDELVTQAVDIYKKGALITVFDGEQDNNTDFDTVILKALFKACTASKQTHPDATVYKEQLKLAVVLNSVGFAKSDLFNGGIPWQDKDLEDLMKDVLVNKKAQFLRLFTENGLSITKYLTYKRLDNLYESLSESSLTTSLLQKYLKKNSDDEKNKLIHILQVSELLSKIFGGVCKPIYESLLESNSEDNSTAAAKVKYPWMSLFIWSVLQNHSEMAMYFWEMSGESVLSALCACKILRELAKFEHATDTKLSLEELAQKFEEKAFDVFSACYQSSESRSFTLLRRTSQMWGKVTCLQMAVAANARHFFSHDGVQTLLSQIWWGDMTKGTEIWKLVFSILMPPLIFTNLISFSKPQPRHTGSFEQTKHVPLPETSQEWVEDEKLVGGSCDGVTNSKTGTIKKKAENREEYPEEFKSFMVERWKQFWFAPVTTFVGNTLMYFPFLFLFAYVLLAEFKPPPEGPAPIEYVLYFWVFTMFCEEIRQCFDTDKTGFSQNVRLYIQDKWNKFDLLAIVLFCIGLICRMFSKSYWAGRSVLCVDYMVFTLRLIHIFAANKHLGPKIIIVGKMVKDVFFFLFLFGVWLLAYGVANQALLYSYDPRHYWVFRRVFFRPYLLIYGHLPLEELDVQKSEKTACTNEMDLILKGAEPCLDSEVNWLVLVLLAVYLLVTNILLLNLLIAMFSNTFNNVQENSDKHWKFQRYDLIVEYHYRSCLAPPFIIFSHLIMLIKKNLKNQENQENRENQNDKSDSTKTQPLSLSLGNLEVSILNTWEAVQKENLLFKQSKKQEDSDTERLKRTSDKVDDILKKITDQNRNKLCFSPLTRTMSKMLERDVVQTFTSSSR